MDEKEFKQRIIPITPKIYALAFRYLNDTVLAEDATQEIMIKLWTARKKLGQHTNSSGFALVTAKHYCLDQLKKKHPRLTREPYQLSRLTAADDQGQVEELELNTLLLRIINQLPSQQREVMIMRSIDGLSYTEIEALTNCKVSHLRVLVSRARQQIAKALEKSYSHNGIR